jgi:hypothetical protein
VPRTKFEIGHHVVGCRLVLLAAVPVLMAGRAVLTTSAGKWVVELDGGAESDLSTAKDCVGLMINDMGADASDACGRLGLDDLFSPAAARVAEVACEDRLED